MKTRDLKHRKTTADPSNSPPLSPPQLLVQRGDDGERQVLLKYSPADKDKALQELIRSFGLLEGDATWVLLKQLSRLVDLSGKLAETNLNGLLALMRGIAPRDTVEAMIAAQMVAVHMATMEQAQFLRRADGIEDVDCAGRLLAKLARTFTAQIESLSAHRGKRTARVVVEHVTVNRGGQAIVGTVATRSHGKNRGQPHERVRVSKREPMLS